MAMHECERWHSSFLAKRELTTEEDLRLQERNRTEDRIIDLSATFRIKIRLTPTILRPLTDGPPELEIVTS